MPDNRLPTNQSQLDIVNKLDEIKDAIAQGGGGGGTGGHTIIDENGNSMTARAGLQFVGAKVSDDATNNKTIVDMSGGGVYIEKTLWEDANGLQFAPNNIQTITLSESLNKYDFIYVDVSALADTGYHNQNILAVSSLYDENDGYNGVVCIGGDINRASSFAKVDNTHLKFIGFSSANPLIVWKVVGIKVSGDYYAPVIYSTEEREIGVWTDGKPLYEKTFYKDNLATTFTDFIKFVDMDNPETFVSIRWTAIRNLGSSGIYKYTGNGASYTEAQSINHFILMRGYGNELQYRLGDNYGITEMWATVQYTKTTDVAGSGSWTPQGVPTHKYSTEEHIVGTWIDGSTLYEKTYDFSSEPISIPSSSNFMTSDIDSSNMGVVTNVFANHSDGTLYNDMSADPTGNNHTKLKLKSVGGATAYYLTLQYTKTS